MKRATLALRTGSLLLLASPLFATTASAKGTYNHDISAYKNMATATIDLLKAGKMAEAYAKSRELEKAWDTNTKDLRSAERTIWKMIDTQLDVAIEATDPAKGGKADNATVQWQKFLYRLGKVPAE